MPGDFTSRVDEFLAKMPKKKVSGRVVVDQVYAHYQHEGVDLHHPDGGEPFYLREPLFAKADDYLKNLRDAAITEDGPDLERAMQENVEDLSLEVYHRAPLEFGDLKGSGHPIVEKDGETVYDRPPNVPRLDPDELKIKARLRYLFDPNRYGRRR